MKTNNMLYPHMRLITLCTLAYFLSLCAGCQGAKQTSPQDTTVTITFNAGAQVNPDDDGRASPIIINLVQLTDYRQFEREDFLSLYENPAAVLGHDFISHTKLQELSPGESREETFTVSPNCRFVGLIAEYSQYETARPTLILPLTPNQHNQFNIAVKRTAIDNTSPSH